MTTTSLPVIVLTSSDTRPADSRLGQIVYETDTENFYILEARSDGGRVWVALEEHFDIDTSALEDEAVTTGKIEDLAVTTGKLAAGAVTSAKMDAGLIRYAETVLTSAQVKALKATPITLVAAAGDGFAVIPIAASLLSTYGGTNAFTESADDLSFAYATAGEVLEFESTGFIDQTNDEWRYVTFSHAETFIPANNEAFVLTNQDDEIAGNAGDDNTLTVGVWYRVIVVPEAA